MGQNKSKSSMFLETITVDKIKMRKNVRIIHPLMKGVILFALGTYVFLLSVTLTIALKWIQLQQPQQNRVRFIHHSAAACPQNIREPQCLVSSE